MTFTNQSGSFANNVIVSGTIFYAQSGSIASDVSALSGFNNNYTQVIVSSGGIINSAFTDGWGVIVVQSGGLLSGVFASSNNTTGDGIQVRGGHVVSAVIEARSNEFVSAGGVDSLATIITGNQVILSGGIASGATVSELGYQVISSGATAVSTTASSGGYVAVSSGGILSGVTAESSGTVLISAGASAISGTIRGDGVSFINAGSVTDLIVTGGGSGTNIGKADQIVVESGSTFVNDSSGVVTNIQVSGEDASFLVLSGVAQNTTLTDGAYQEIDGGVVTNTQIRDGSTVSLMGGSLVSATVGYGASLNVYGGTVVNLTLQSGAVEYLMYGASVSSQTIGEGVQQQLWGGSASAMTVTSGGLQDIEQDGIAASAFIIGGSQTVNEGGSSIYATVSDGGSVSVDGGGILTSATIESRGTATVLSGVVSSVAVNSGGQLLAESSVIFCGQIADAGIVSGGVITSGANISVLSGGIASGTYASNGSIWVSAGGSANNVSAASGLTGYSQIITLSGGSVTNVSASGWSNIVVSSGGILSNVTVISATNGGDGLQVKGGVANHVLVGPKGVIVVSGGVVSSLSVAGSNARGVVTAGGSISGLTLTSQGRFVTIQGGTVSGGTVLGAGTWLYGSSGGTIADVTVTSGGQININSGAIVVSNTIGNGGQYFELAGTLDSSTTNIFQSGADIKITSDGLGNYGTVQNFSVGSGVGLRIQDGASGSNVTVSNGGTERVFNGGITINGMVLSGGNLLISAGGTGKGTIVNGGTLTVSNEAYVSGVIVNSGGLAAVVNSGVIYDLTVNNGGSSFIASAASLSGTMTLENGGQATIWADAGGTIIMGGSTNTGLVVSGLASGGTLSTVISGFDGTSGGASDGVTIAGLSQANVKNVVNSSDGNSVTINLVNGSPITLNIPGIGQQQYVEFTKDGMLFEVCFLAGSMLRTPTGERAVEDMAIGDEICVYDWRNAAELTRSVKWVGHKKMVVRSHLPDDEAGYPVRILKNAVSDGVPYKDLLVTPEHCLFFDGQFIPVRMLVNGRSIFYDRSFTSYTYYHVETDPHSVIWADGTLTESYLDTGNRSTFAQGGTLVLFGDKNVKTWEEDGEAALTVARHQVEPIFRNLEARAEYAGLGLEAPQQKLVDDADLHLVTEAGVVLRRVRENNGHSVFMIPPGVQQVRMVSRTSRPSDTIGPFVDDRRYLGVLVGSIQFFESRDTRKLDQHLKSDQLEGWDVKEAAPCRWTNGNALLSIGAREPGSIGMLVIQVLAAGPYVQNEQKDQVEVMRQYAILLDHINKRPNLKSCCGEVEEADKVQYSTGQSCRSGLLGADG
ncbi:Hint domain-containing protein [Gluconobacter cerinus]|nr:Hint domain-containing protein [Gluconobacter cerinus]